MQMTSIIWQYSSQAAWLTGEALPIRPDRARHHRQQMHIFTGQFVWQAACR